MVDSAQDERVEVVQYDKLDSGNKKSNYGNLRKFALKHD